MYKKIIFTICLLILSLCIYSCIVNRNFREFVSIIEDKTFDIRQSVLVQEHYRQSSDSIVIVAIDDATYEYMLNVYGEWPMPRSVYVKMLDYIESQSPRSVIFDMMFVKSASNTNQEDTMLSDAFKRYNNAFTAINFDNQAIDVRPAEDLPDKLALKIENNSKKVNLHANSYTNYRGILDDIINNTNNIGVTNVNRSTDGVLRKVPIAVEYKGKYYPQLGFAAGLHYLNKNENQNTKKLRIDENSYLQLGTKKIHLEKDGKVILNWYSANRSYTYIPAYKLFKIINGDDIGERYLFKDKIVFIGTTAVSLYDIKTVPVSKNMPGVEVQATYLNNIIDGSFINKLSGKHTVKISVLLALITILIVLGESSALIGAFASVSLFIAYILTTYFVMKYFNVWLEIVNPIFVGIMTVISAYVIKYFIKSKDFDKQYLLATTDGLTELYNHRYFKEQMRQMIESSSRYGSLFSLIILDIDFFKKFNDTYGHQAGDAVLKQVAQTLKRNVRSSDIVCRYGGEEMSIILPNTDYDMAVATADKLCKRIATRSFKLPNNKEVSVNISLGASTFPIDGINAEEIIEMADKRLYNAKQTGRNKVGS